jgi:myo-inositol-1(or 4)-monophosphatase
MGGLHLHDREQMREVAVLLAREAGKLAWNAFGKEKSVQVKGTCGDFVTEVDEQAERLIAEGLKRHFPSHAILGEEFGSAGQESGEFLWMIDPLDGTNNFAIGLPVYAVCLTCMYRGEPVLGVIYDPVLDRMMVAEKGEGTTLNGRPVRMKRNDVEHLTLAWVQGHQVQKETVAMNLKHHLDRHTKRVLCLWAPSLAWMILAQGEIDGIVVYRSGGMDLFAGLLAASEAGAFVSDLSGKPFTVDPEKAKTALTGEISLVACHPARREEVLELVSQGLISHSSQTVPDDGQSGLRPYHRKGSDAKRVSGGE